MGKKLTPKIILEGTRLTLKTEIAFALNEHPRIVGPRRYRYHSPLVSAEWCAFTNVPWGRGLINFAPEEEALALDTYRTWIKLFEQLRYYSWIVDRFHISTRAYQLRNHGKDYDFTWLEDANGDMVEELPGHGLVEQPGELTRIGDVVMDNTGDDGTPPNVSFSNNVGMLKMSFYVAARTPVPVGSKAL